MNRVKRAYLVAAAVAAAILIIPWAQSSRAEDSPDSPRITDGSQVTMLYRISVPGEGFEAKDVGQFIQGQHQVLPALEREVNGMKSGEEKEIELPPEEGFGPYDPQKRKTIARAQLPADAKSGDVVKDRTNSPATVTELSESTAVLDYNHPLAGKPLKISLKILKVDQPKS
ncbi:MAG TPA: FKBP-type peptidyl-prolyl cis-trans isomerase [Nitrospira sp.]|nr:FKBP-type peptidyl-prolyl cis-trans isomerase [Nitrospira sp.]